METIHFQSLVDAGFAIFVTFACLKMLLPSSASGASARDKWRQELSEVEQCLTDLIREAAASSRNLDRQLQKRQEELSDLLGQLERAQNSKKEKLSTSSSLPSEDEFPNSTWLRSPNQTISTGAISDTNTSPASNPTQPDRRTPKTSRERSLMESVEITREVKASLAEQSDDRRMAFSIPPSGSSPIVDPIAYKIAKRLLEEGKEIHVVARKLDLPLAEVRALDKLVSRPSPEPMHNSEYVRQSGKTLSEIKKEEKHIDFSRTQIGELPNATQVDFKRESALI
ncbi:MAG: hypothetical protein IT291_08135 [Deltaproteobacteria bacterium]|nr:hypothetical protein [Deltaproteobacteria bacterium]